MTPPPQISQYEQLVHDDVIIEARFSNYLRTDFNFEFLILKLVCMEILMLLPHSVRQISKKPPFAQIRAQLRHNGGQILKIFKNRLRFWILLHEISMYGKFDVFSVCGREDMCVWPFLRKSGYDAVMQKSVTWFMNVYQNSDARFEFSRHFSISVHMVKKIHEKLLICMITMHFQFYMENIGKTRRFPKDVQRWRHHPNNKQP